MLSRGHRMIETPWHMRGIVGTVYPGVPNGMIVESGALSGKAVQQGIVVSEDL